MQADVFMQRCLWLAGLGAGKVAPNPMVGAMLVHEDKIIGEGWHEIFGGPHAEVNAVNDAIRRGKEELIQRSVLYVSLEPCCHYGKTPPCTDLVIQRKIKKVVIGCRDPFPGVNGKGIERLREAGIEVSEGILEEKCRELNKRFFVFNKHHRPYIILKWAESANRKVGAGTEERILISNEYSNRLVHKWRSEEAAILIGTNTALLDDPRLTNRLWKGNNPARLVVDMDLKLPAVLKIFNDEALTVIFNTIRQEKKDNLLFYQVTPGTSLVQQISNALYSLKIQSVLVEGGARLLQSFIDEGVWDEARVIRNRELEIRKGLDAPQLHGFEKFSVDELLNDQVTIFKRVES